jgi:hypothetical protein
MSAITSRISAPPQLEPVRSLILPSGHQTLLVSRDNEDCSIRSADL